MAQDIARQAPPAPAPPARASSPASAGNGLSSPLRLFKGLDEVRGAGAPSGRLLGGERAVMTAMKPAAMR
ncbi:hypothetical protein [Streptomyces aurantiogriseus]|uniref:hypothetical protein n=1 Tax=Streptomyces aurantiogriseus TaxID=66870 RepID=UPI00167AF24F|nr:hypothetical protein [Streptomyces aurantiogriseus]